MEENKKLFIGNISFGTEFEQILELFTQFGEIEDSYHPVGKGFGFITFKSADDAAKAIEEMNGKEVDGRELVVNIARPREERPRTFGGNRGGFGGGNRGGFGGGRDDRRGGGRREF